MRLCVVDSNVVVSGIMGRRGPSVALVDAFFGDQVCWVFDGRIIEEYGEVLARPKFGITASERYALFQKLQGHGRRVSTLHIPLSLPDEDDRPYLEAASAAACPIVTKNLVDFAPAEKLGIRVLTPQAAVAELLSP